MEESNPPKACDPLAVASAVSLRKQMGQKGAEGLTEQQKKIYLLIMERRQITREEIQQTLNLTPDVLESEFATLRHCELIRAHKEGSNVYLTLW
jgi:predicted HTH transcriptional regulator